MFCCCQCCTPTGLSSFLCLPGPISSVLVNTYGCRPMVMIGGCLCSLGMILASFCTSVLQLYLCIGVIGGKSLESAPSPFEISR